MFKEGSSGNLGNAETKFGRHMISIPPFGNPTDQWLWHAISASLLTCHIIVISFILLEREEEKCSQWRFDSCSANIWLPCQLHMHAWQPRRQGMGDIILLRMI
jgi:hypothetical protein